jgi:hypothetical protein
MNNTKIFDFFISYKRKDTSEFVESLKIVLESSKYDVWLDTVEVLPGDSILTSIEKGMTNSLTTILVFSQHYFEGWSEHERRAAFNLANSGRIKIMPIWYKVESEFVQKNAPLFADMLSIVCDLNKPFPEIDVANQLKRSIRPSYKRGKLFEFFFKSLRNHFPDDPDLKLFIAVYDNDTNHLEEAINQGANVNITDIELYNRYAREAIDKGCFEEWRKLYLFLHESRQLNSQNDD